ncbi:hypothetical protein [Paracoccus sp. Ld10]|uniref:hypothetical protein n=1 Tax=Paracoccus sp. Ld10 TaxID=649158 RepID=UPI003865D295
MTQHFDGNSFLQSIAGDSTEMMQKLSALLERISWDEPRQRLSFRNGQAAIHLLADGTIRLEGMRIVQSADKDITLSAAWIDLN